MFYDVEETTADSRERCPSSEASWRMHESASSQNMHSLRASGRPSVATSGLSQAVGMAPSCFLVVESCPSHTLYVVEFFRRAS